MSSFIQRSPRESYYIGKQISGCRAWGAGEAVTAKGHNEGIWGAMKLFRTLIGVVVI